MLSTVLSTLTTLTSKSFVISAFFPVLTFAFLNGVLLQLVFKPFDTWAAAQISAGAGTVGAVIAFVGLAIVAYILWSLNNFLREQLEGHSQTAWGRSRFATWLKKRQQARLRQLSDRVFEARNERGALAPEAWTDRLIAAAVTGSEQHPGVLAYSVTSREAGLVRQLVATQKSADRPTAKDLTDAVTAFERVLAANDVTVNGGQNILAADRRLLISVFDYAVFEWEDRLVALARQLETDQGQSAVAPTAFGNVAASLASYTRTRYRMDLASCWNRLLPLLPKEQGLVVSLQDAKTQLDFLVSCVWMSGLTWLGWYVALPILGAPWSAFVLLAIAGPIVTGLCYWAGVQSYVAFGDLVRTAVDLHRLELLDAMGIARPTRLGREREVWHDLSALLAFGQEGVDIGYRRPAVEKPAGDKK